MFGYDFLVWKLAFRVTWQRWRRKPARLVGWLTVWTAMLVPAIVVFGPSYLFRLQIYLLYGAKDGIKAETPGHLDAITQSGYIAMVLLHIGILILALSGSNKEPQGLARDDIAKPSASNEDSIESPRFAV